MIAAARARPLLSLLSAASALMLAGVLLRSLAQPIRAAPLARAASSMSGAIKLTPDGGITKEITQAGHGDETPPPGAMVQAHYTGRLLDGTVFDSSHKRGKPFSFTIGQGQVIKGWDVGIATMTKGEKATLTCTAPYAYGRRGAGGVIPPDATLKFDVELIDFI